MLPVYYAADSTILDQDVVGVQIRTPERGSRHLTTRWREVRNDLFESLVYFNQRFRVVLSPFHGVRSRNDPSRSRIFGSSLMS